MEKETIWVAAFDIGKKNFSWCVEEYNEDELKAIIPLSNKLRYNKDGTETDAFKNILNKIYSNGSIVDHRNTDLTKECKEEKSLEYDVFVNMYTLLDQYIDLWSRCNYILIEEQMHFGSKINFTAVKLAQHCFSYFVYKFGRDKVILDFPAYHKTQVLGAPKIPGKAYKSGLTRFKAMDKPARKKWAVNKALSILSFRGEESLLSVSTSIPTSKKQKKIKKDDLADTFLMIQAFKVLNLDTNFYSQ